MRSLPLLLLMGQLGCASPSVFDAGSDGDPKTGNSDAGRDGGVDAGFVPLSLPGLDAMSAGVDSGRPFEPVRCRNWAPSLEGIELTTGASMHLWASRSVRDSVGTPCAKAIDSAACMAEFAELPRRRFLVFGFGLGGSYAYWEGSASLILTGFPGARDTGDPNELAAALAPIDSKQKAALMVWAQNLHELGCYERDAGTGGVREAVDGGYEVRSLWGIACGSGAPGAYQMLTHVHPDGRVVQTAADLVAAPNSRLCGDY